MNKSMNEDAAVHALAAILKGTPGWNPREGDMLSISCTTSYVFISDTVQFKLTRSVIEAARVISGVPATDFACESLGLSKKLMSTVGG
jgi:hypothetical protein